MSGMDMILTLALMLIVVMPIGLVLLNLAIDLYELTLANRRRKNCTGAKRRKK